MSKTNWVPKTKREQMMFSERMNKELEKVQMSWSNQLKEWYPLAIKALEFASAPSLQIEQQNFVKLFKTDTYGINMNIVALLCNNLEMRTPHEMGVTAAKWSEILLLNHAVANSWEEIVRPIRESVSKQMEIISGIPTPQIGLA